MALADHLSQLDVERSQARDRVVRLVIDALAHLDPSSPLHGPADWS
jgi:hypothetical protein